MINEACDGVESFRADNLINTFKLIIDFLKGFTLTYQMILLLNTIFGRKIFHKSKVIP